MTSINLTEDQLRILISSLHEDLIHRIYPLMLSNILDKEKQESIAAQMRESESLLARYKDMLFVPIDQ